MIENLTINNNALQINLEHQFDTARKAGVTDSDIISHHRDQLRSAQRDGNAALIERHSAALEILKSQQHD